MKLLASLLLLLAPLLAGAEPWVYTRASVLTVTDGDTLRVRIETEPDHYWEPRIRLSDGSRRIWQAPEMNTEEGRAAKAALERLLEGCEQVVVRIYRHDKYGGRVNGDLAYCGRDSLLADLVEAGWVR